jgi:hypothetical protein
LCCCAFGGAAALLFGIAGFGRLCGSFLYWSWLTCTSISVFNLCLGGTATLFLSGFCVATFGLAAAALCCGKCLLVYDLVYEVLFVKGRSVGDLEVLCYVL